MDIRLASLIGGARSAEGTVIIIDVFRAFTTAAIAFSRGADRIVLVAEVEEALALRRRGVGDLCMGEVDGMRPEGFDFGNSPFEISQADLGGKTLIQSTRAGTVGVTSASRAAQLYAASFVTAAASARAVSRKNPGLVTVVAMGAEGREQSDEDEQCALYIRDLLRGCRPDRGAVRGMVLGAPVSRKFDDPSQPHFHPMDREIALRIDSQAFAISVSREEGLFVARPEQV